MIYEAWPVFRAVYTFAVGDGKFVLLTYVKNDMLEHIYAVF